MGKALITDYGMLMKAIGKDFQNDSCQPINNTKLLGLIKERYGEATSRKYGVAPVYEYRLNIPGCQANYLYLVDIKADDPEKRKVFIRDGIYVYDELIINVINIDCGVFIKDDANFEDVGSFFENFRTTLSNFFIDTVLRPTDSIFLTYFGAFCAVYGTFDMTKESMIEMQNFMKPANKVVAKDNTIYENMLALYNAPYIQYLHVCRAYEDGVENVVSNSVPVTKIVPQVQQGGN